MAAKSKDLKQLLEGYARVMLIWALLRVLMSLFEIIKLIMSGVQPGFVSLLAIFLIILAQGLYLGFTGRFGEQSLRDSSKLKIFKLMSIVGAAISGALLCIYLYWLVAGLAYTHADVFCTSIEFLLYAVGVYYAWRIEQDTK